MIRILEDLKKAKRQSISLAALAGLLAVVVHHSAATAQTDKTYLFGAGATFPAPLYLKWIEEFEAANGDIDVEYDVVGSGEGISKFLTGSVDFGASDRALSDDDIAGVERGVQLIPATAGLVVLAYNLPEIDQTIRLPRDVEVDIFDGLITEWDDPRIQEANPDIELPGLTIALVARSDGSGTTFAFTNHLSAISPAWAEGPGAGTLVGWPGNMMRARGNEGVAAQILRGHGTLGYVEYGFAERLGLPMAMLQNKAGQFVVPDLQSGQAALSGTADQMPENLKLFIPDPDGEDAYPITTYSWLMLYGAYDSAEKKAALEKFVTYGLTDGQQFAEELGYIPLPGEVAELALAGLKNVK